MTAETHPGLEKSCLKIILNVDPDICPRYVGPEIKHAWDLVSLPRKTAQRHTSWALVILTQTCVQGTWDRDMCLRHFGVVSMTCQECITGTWGLGPTCVIHGVLDPDVRPKHLGLWPGPTYSATGMSPWTYVLGTWDLDVGKHPRHNVS